MRLLLFVIFVVFQPVKKPISANAIVARSGRDQAAATIADELQEKNRNEFLGEHFSKESFARLLELIRF